MGPGLRRVELSLPADDPDALRAVLPADFRLEGVRPQVLELPDGSYVDLCLPARPASDQVAGATVSQRDEFGAAEEAPYRSRSDARRTRSRAAV